jgi:hypothetical protein
MNPSCFFAEYGEPLAVLLVGRTIKITDAAGKFAPQSLANRVQALDMQAPPFVVMQASEKSIDARRAEQDSRKSCRGAIDCHDQKPENGRNQDGRCYGLSLHSMVASLPGILFVKSEKNLQGILVGRSTHEQVPIPSSDRVKSQNRLFRPPESKTELVDTGT